MHVLLWKIWPRGRSEGHGSFRWDVSGSRLKRSLGGCEHCLRIQKVLPEDMRMENVEKTEVKRNERDGWKRESWRV